MGWIVDIVLMLCVTANDDAEAYEKAKEIFIEQLGNGYDEEMRLIANPKICITGVHTRK